MNSSAKKYRLYIYIIYLLIFFFYWGLHWPNIYRREKIHLEKKIDGFEQNKAAPISVPNIDRMSMFLVSPLVKNIAITSSWLEACI